MFQFVQNLSKPSYFLDGEGVAPEDKFVVHGGVGERLVEHLLYDLGGDFILEIIEADDIGLLQLQQIVDPIPLLYSELQPRVELNGFQQ